MKCRYCQTPAGFLNTYHAECREQFQKARQKLLLSANTYADRPSDTRKTRTEMALAAIACPLYQNGLSWMLYDETAIRTNETLIFIEDGLTLLESKNRCTMVRTGYRYEKMPTWSECTVTIGKNANIMFTDKAIYLNSMEGTMRYAYNHIVNIGHEKFSSGIYFDVKTTSPYPHRFFIKPTGVLVPEKTQNVFLLLKCMLGWQEV